MLKIQNASGHVIQAAQIILCLFICTCYKRDQSVILNPDDISNYRNDKILLITSIPGTIRSNPLVIRGAANGYSTVFCEGEIRTVETGTDEHGLFEMAVPVLEEKKNLLKMYAMTSGGICSDTLRIEFTHISDRSIQISTDLPDYTSQDNLVINGTAPYYWTVFCRSGNQTFADTVENYHFSISVPLMFNQKNNFYIYARDIQGQFSDTIHVSLIHDNLPPRLVHSSTDNEPFSCLQGSVLLDFSEPVIPGRLQLDFGNNNNSVLNDFQYPDPNTIEVLYKYFSLVRDYRIQVIVSDSAGNRLDTTCTFKTYLKKHSSNFNITDMFRSVDGSQIFILAGMPNILAILNTLTWEIEVYYPLSYVPSRGDQNPVNQSLYVASYEERMITEIDPRSGREIEFIHTVENENEPSWPDKPVSIAFLESGKGFITCVPQGASGPYSVQVLDSRDSNRLAVHHQFDPYTFQGLFAFHFNNRKDCLLIDLTCSSTTAYLYHEDQDEFIRIISEGLSDNYIHHAVGHHRENLINCDGIYSFLFDNAGQLIGQTGYKVITTPYDFTYRENEGTLAYYYDVFESEFSIIDLTSGDKLLHSPMNGGDASALLTTYDGRFIILQTQNEIAILETHPFREFAPPQKE